ncbi:MAG TPA: ABC transporter ATP-binding protein [Ornithinibacter sp.]|nr:ABC transporter ATP-binding protein [Ornithinibacter sp.]
MTAPVLSCRGVVHDYDGALALRGVDLDVLEGEVVAVTGPSGSGKSTLLLCLAGIVVPSQGSVHLGGVDLRALGERGRATLRRESVGVVFQYGTLVPELTGEENVALPLLLSGRARRAALAAAREWLDRLGVGAVGRTTAARMSGGERQRVALARALVTTPRVVLADEPTGALDSLASDLVVTELVGAARDAGAAVVLVTHDARVAAHADREVHLWDGRVDGLPAADAPPASDVEQEVLR